MLRRSNGDLAGAEEVGAAGAAGSFGHGLWRRFGTEDFPNLVVSPADSCWTLGLGGALAVADPPSATDRDEATAFPVVLFWATPVLPLATFFTGLRVKTFCS